MALRRPSWPFSRLQLSTVASIAASRYDPPIRLRSTAGRRHMASVTRLDPPLIHDNASSISQDGSAEQQTGLGDLLRAVQRQDMPAICDAFIAWTDVLSTSAEDDGAQGLKQAAIQQAHDLPIATLSEILRCIDPVLYPEQDIAHGLNLTFGHTEFTDVGKLVDEFGVRVHHRRILAAVKALVVTRVQSQRPLLPVDYQMAMRCAGAAADYQSSKDFWTVMGQKLPRNARSSQSWNDFVSARFMTKPMYYQYDRARVAVLARDLHRNRNPIPFAKLKAMDAIRFSRNDLKIEPWNRRRDETSEDLTRLLRSRLDFRSVQAHWNRALGSGHVINEEMICTAMIGFSRSTSLLAIMTLFKRNYDILIEGPLLPKDTADMFVLEEDEVVEKPPVQQVDTKTHVSNRERRAIREDFFSSKELDSAEAPAEAPTEITISGGRLLHVASPLYPTHRLMNAIADAFGTMAHISLGRKLLQFVSQSYGVPIPHETWSRLLNWTYVCVSRPFKAMRNIHGAREETTVTPGDVLSLWTIMTSKPCNFVPTFDDTNVYIKTLITRGSLNKAIEVIREHAIPHYQAAGAEHQDAFCDELLQRDTGYPTPRATHRRQKAEVQKDFIYHHISTYFSNILKSASSSRLQREGDFTRVRIPALLAEFGDFLPRRVEYRVTQGAVQITRPSTVQRFRVVEEMRETLPQNLGSAYGPPFGEPGPSREESDTYPKQRQKMVLHSRRKPVPRVKSLPEVPQDERKGGVWATLERELML